MASGWTVPAHAGFGNDEQHKPEGGHEYKFQGRISPLGSVPRILRIVEASQDRVMKCRSGTAWPWPYPRNTATAIMFDSGTHSATHHRDNAWASHASHGIVFGLDRVGVMVVATDEESVTRPGRGLHKAGRGKSGGKS